MKKILLVTLLIVIATSLSFSQMAFKKGDNVIALGIGLGGVAGAYGTGGLPLSISYENAVTENISIGGLFGYASTSEEAWGVKASYTNIIIGARGAFHADLIKNPNIDTYGGIILGYNIVSSSVEDNGYWGGYSWSSSAGSYMFFGAFIGGRYYFNPNLAAQVELGYGMGILNVGIAYKF